MEAGAEELGTIAYNHFLSVSRNRAIQIVATNLMLSTDEIEPKILAYLQGAHGFPPDQTPEQWGDYVSDLIAWAHDERKTEFQGTRRSAVVATCSALENSAKCLFVARAELDPTTLESIATKRVSVSVSDYVNLAERDRYFALADKLFQDTDSKWHFDKFSNYVKLIAPEMHANFDAQTKDIEKTDFNEAFSVRNCIVHHGARATKALSTFAQFPIGTDVRITVDSQKRYLKAMRAFAGAIANITPPILEEI